MIRALRRNAATLLVALVLGAAGSGAALVNADAGPPRTLFLQLPEDTPEPGLALSAERRSDGRWMLDIHTTGFRFKASCLPVAAAAPVGHAHVLRDGAKIASAFVPQVDLGRLGPGTHRYRVVLRGRDHRVLLGRQGAIEAELTIEIGQDGLQPVHLDTARRLP